VRLVLDTNILLAGLLRDGATRRLLLEPSLDLLVPEHALEEVERHLPDLARRMGLPVEQARLALGLLLERVDVVPKTAYDASIGEAEGLLRGSDLDDAPFLALALALGAPLWTHDKALHAQQRVPTLATRDVLSRVGFRP
jgi:predicted nucleic acid-binding protein